MGQAIGAMIKTAPFIIFRIIIYVGIALARSPIPSGTRS